MRRLFVLTLFCCTCAFTPLLSQWRKAYGGAGIEYAYSIEPTLDGGIIIAGAKQVNPPNTDTDYWIMRLTATGEKMWEKTYGSPTEPERLWSLRTTPDGGFLIAGFTGIQNGGGESATMYKLDANGEKVWEKSLNMQAADHAHFLFERETFGYFMGGHTDSKGDSRGDIWLVKMDDNRNILWDSTYDHSSGEHAHAGRETPDGGCIILGHATVNGLEKFWVMKVDSNGGREWDKILSSSPVNYDPPYYVVTTREGGYALFGGSGSITDFSGTMWMIVLDKDGEIVLNKHYGGQGFDSFAWSGRQTSDGGYILAGYTNAPTFQNYDMYIVKTDADGEVEWDTTFGAEGQEQAYGVIETTDGYIVSGETSSSSWMTGGLLDGVILKIAKTTSSGIAQNEGVVIHRSYPNPVRLGSAVTIETPETASALDIYDRLGSRVASVPVNEAARRFTWSLVDASGAAVPAGAYFYVATTAKGRLTGSIIVE